MKSQFKLTREGFVERMRRFPSSHGYSPICNITPVTKGNITLYNSEGRIMQVMPFRSRKERKELFKRVNNIKGVCSFGLVFYSS
jgi:hypothetical protein